VTDLHTQDMMREVWRAHSWSDPVPGKTFISSLNEYYEKKFSSQYDSKHWVLEYINPPHAELIIEAVDADGSGHVSAQELDNFTALKPNDWRCVTTKLDDSKL
jgi:hypothetical protein